MLLPIRNRLPRLEGGVEGGRANTAYVIPYGTDAATKLAVRMLAEGFKLAVATRQLNAGGRDWPAGTLVARTDRNPATIHDRIGVLARETAAQVFAVNSAYSEQGDTGVGSESIASLKQPRVAVVWDEATSPTSYGATWYGFEQGYGLKFTPVSVAAIKSADLSKFNVIVLPDGSAGAYQTLLGKDGIDKLKSWVQAGNVLVATGGAAAFFTRKDVALTSSRLVGAEEDSAATTAPAPAAPAPAPAGQAAASSTTDNKPSEKRAEAETKPEQKPADKPQEKPKPKEPLSVPGAAFKAKINREHFLSYGYDSDTIAVLMDGNSFFRPSKEGANVVTFTSAGPLLVSGFVWPDNTEELLRGTAYVIDEPTGGGHVILFAEDPTFRYLWRTTQQMFMNAILLAPSM